jgi:hypothetical protein
MADRDPMSVTVEKDSVIVKKGDNEMRATKPE